MFNNMYAKSKISTAKKLNECISEGKEKGKAWDMIAHDEMDKLCNKGLGYSLLLFGFAFIVVILSTFFNIYNDFLDWLILVLITAGVVGIIFTVLATYVIHRRLKEENPHKRGTIYYA